MFGGSKLGRGGGRTGAGAGGANKRCQFPTPTPHRLSAASASSNRLSMGSSAARNRAGGRGGGGGGVASGGGLKAVEESFSLVSGNNPLAFAMIIRLAPDLVEEIRKVESEGQTARIKFDSMSNNPNGNEKVESFGHAQLKNTWDDNFDLCYSMDMMKLQCEEVCEKWRLTVDSIVNAGGSDGYCIGSLPSYLGIDGLYGKHNAYVIDVGGKEFRFTWSRELGDLCDIYEERQCGEDGNGLLVESGCAWRKLNVQRVLDESTTNHVKKLSEEAERKLKSRRAIVLDPGNPSMKNQIKQLAAVEANPWRTQYKQKKEPPFKKRKVETLQVSGPPKPSIKSGVSSTATLKGRRSASPLPSSPGQPAAPASPGNIVKSNVSVEEITSNRVKGKEIASNPEKEIPSRSSTPGHKGNSGAKPIDLQNMLMTLLMENPKGLSLKALEKAVGDKIPNSARKIEPIIKKIALLQAPGRYFLKPGVELDELKKLSSESGSSPEDNHNQAPATEDIHDKTPAPGLSVVEKVAADEMEERAQSNSKFGDESVPLERVDIQQYSSDLFGEKKVSDNSEGRAGSDEDVDIMTSDDDKDPNNKFQASKPGFPTLPIPCRTADGRPVQNEIDDKQDDDGSDAVDIEGHGSDAVDIEGQGSDAIDIEGHGCDAVDIEKDLRDDEQEIEMAVNSSLDYRAKKAEDGIKTLSDHDELQERHNFIGNLFEDKETVANDSFRHDQFDSSERISKSKSKRGPDPKHVNERSELAKRSKGESSVRPPISGVRDSQLLESPSQLSPNRFTGEPYKGPATQMMNRADRDGNVDFVSQKGYNQPFSGKPDSDSQQSGRKSFDQNTPTKAHDAAKKPNKHGRRSSEKSFQAHEGYPTQKDKVYRDAQNEDSFPKEKKGLRNRKDGGSGTKNSMPFDSNYGKHGEMVSKLNETGQVPSSQMGNGRGSKLQRELSDLELGELREPLHEETPSRKQFERKGSFKQSENKSSTSDNCNSDLTKGKPIGKAALDTGKPSPPNVRVGIRRTTPEHLVEDSTRTHYRNVQSQPQHLSRVDHAEAGSQFNKSTEASGKSIQIEARVGGGLEGSEESQRKALSSASQQHDSKRGPLSLSLKDSRTQTSNVVADMVGGRKDAILTESNDSGQKRRESSSEEDSCSYYKYEKDEPELKGPIKDFSQYKDYLQEYQDKYDSYISLNKILESDRDKFQKLGKDLDFAKGRDVERYCKLLGQLKDSYSQCGTMHSLGFLIPFLSTSLVLTLNSGITLQRHKRLKKIFVVLHEELKVIHQSYLA
ncbi:hypothetical protein JRO89_XS09G0204900 [Xanthoceras sorbifolium]|uniref:OCEL domain-containing protein n=1 Tax=Xanthoceras sorbifolium TaxID=99658 RepID=A0ABQ8HM72_9ROSI|nr:hypothetical protein JRO89_XS09G0204900 [Xanthoceras sorbifolium]